MSTGDNTSQSLGRREFLQTAAGGLILLTLTPLGCSSDGEDEQQCTGLRAASRVTSRHSHTVCISAQDLSSPPATGRSYISSNFEAADSGGYAGAAHLHTIFLSAADLAGIAAGATVLIDSTESERHTHEFSIRM